MSHRTIISLSTAAAFLTMVAFPDFSPTPGTAYTTTFPDTENPISEGGRWVNGKANGVDWFDVESTPGKAFGNPTTGNYTDPTAILSGHWGPDQTVTATVVCTNPTPAYYQEVEIRLRSSMTAHSCTGYEILWRCLTDADAYTQVVRWNGPVGDFTYLDKSQNGVGYGVADGDTVSASIKGNMISVYRNGSLLFTVSDSTYKAGNPGMGFNYGVGTTNADFGFARYAAVDNATPGRSRFRGRAGNGYESHSGLNWVQAASGSCHWTLCLGDFVVCEF